MATTANPSGTGADTQKQAEDAGSVLWISGLFIFIGILAFAFLIALVNDNEEFRAAIDPQPVVEGEVAAEDAATAPTDLSELEAENAELVGALNALNNRLESLEETLDPEDTTPDVDLGNVFLTFLEEFGIFYPLVFVGIGFYCIRMGIKLYRRNLVTALWARQLMIWLIVASIAGIIFGIQSAGDAAGGLIVSVLPWVFLLGLVVFVMNWLGSNEHLFYGAETISSREARTAWNLLIPTLVILVVVALQPLEQTFISSLTDRVTAGTQEPQFVGVDNYTELLGVRLDTYPCENDPSVSDCGDADNLQTPRRYFIDTVENYREWRYEPLAEFGILGTDYVISARDVTFLESIYNTLFFTVISVSLELMLGLFIAMVVNSKFPGRGLMRTAMLIPWAIPTVISARLWEVMLRPDNSGVVNVLLENVGLIDSPISWLTQPSTQVWSMVLVDVWKTTPFMALLLLAGLQVIPSDVYEAADVDGASKPRQFLSITLPLLRPTIAVALVFRTLDAVRVFDVFEVLLRGSTKFSMATYNYNQLVEARQFGYASAVGVIIFVIILLFTVAYVRVLGVDTE
jgi:trehalose/maltose transport system permease protein